MSGKRPADDPAGQPTPPKLQKNEAGKPVDPLAAIIAAKKAEFQAKFARMTAMKAGGGQAAPSPPSAAGSLPSAPSRPAAPARSTLPIDIQERIAAAQARLAALGKPTAAPATAPSSARPGATTLGGGGGGAKRERNDDMPRGGLNMGIHPSLLDSSSSSTPVAGSSKDRTKTMAPKFTSLSANARSVGSSSAPGAAAPAAVNPYLAAAEAAQEETKGPQRKARDFKFVQKGRYVQMGDQMRADANMEALKARIAASARKAGMDSEFQSLEKLVKREAPPEVEWWDEPILGSTSYDAVLEGTDKIEDPTGPITFYVQHPVQIQPPWEKKKVEPQALKLTKREAKKMRKQRRMAELQDHQDRVRMGLIPPDAPKVSLKNLMKVLANDAILDPTQVEAKVRRQVENRRLGHERTNEKRKLTQEQKREKVEKEKEKEEEKGLFGAVFRVRYLSNPQHKFKVRRNAEQSNLTGCCIFNPKFCLVYVEGSAKAVKFFKRVMLVRVDWTETARPLPGEEALLPPAKVEFEQEENMAENRCDLMWEGPIKEKTFNRFMPKNTESERAVRDFLGEKNQGYWDIASRFVPDDN